MRYFERRRSNGIRTHDLNFVRVSLLNQLSYAPIKFAGKIGLEPTIIGLTDRSYIPLKLLPQKLKINYKLLKLNTGDCD